MEQHDDTPGGKPHIIEYFSRKQKQVRRSTLGAEQGACIDGFNLSVVIAAALAEINVGPQTATQLLDRVTLGELTVPIETVTDAKSLFEAVKNPEPKTPTEETLLFGFNYLKEHMLSGLLRKIWWCETTDMLADALTKGIIARGALIETCTNGTWMVRRPCEQYQVSEALRMNRIAELKSMGPAAGHTRLALDISL